ncbi:MAG: phytoene desaturase family protein [Egibacteraceae bacterium]
MRTVVVGAGVGGLAAAARLAAAGHTVTICEQAPAVGGKLGRLAFGGAVFDTGPSLLTMPHVLANTFAATGTPMDGLLDLEPVEPIAAYRYADGTRFTSTRHLPAMVTALDQALGPGAGADWSAFLGRAARIWGAVREPFLERALGGAGDLARLAVRVGDLAAVAPHRTLRGLGRRYLRDPRLRMLLDRYATYTGSDPRRAPAALAVVPYVEQAFGAWYVSGGLYRIAEALAARAVERGAALRLGCPVTAVETAGGRVTGVRLADGALVTADVVVANTDAAHLYGDLVGDPAAAGARRGIARAPMSLSGFVVLLALRGRTPGLAHHSVLFPADYDAEFDALFGPDPRPVADPTLYVSAPADPAVRPDGGEAWFVLANAPRSDQVDWAAPGMAGAYADHVVGLLAARGLDIRDRITARRVLTPAELALRTRAVGGAIYGTAAHGPRAAFLRPANRSPVAGLFLVGGSAHPGGGLPLVLLSARIVAGLVGPA